MMSENTKNNSPIVQFENVTKTFNAGTSKEFTAIKDINFVVNNIENQGEFIGLLGPSGCGKSTILNILAGLTPHFPQTKGRVTVNGTEVTGPGRDRGMIFQKYSSFPHLTVIQNIEFGIKLMSEDDRKKIIGEAPTSKSIRKYAKEWIHKVKLSGNENKYPHQLSGGMQQRVAIARSLSVKPKILLLDEPFSALDEPTRLVMQDLLLNLWKETQSTVFMVSHSISEAVYLSDRVWLFTPSPGNLAMEISDIPRMEEGALLAQERSDFKENSRIIAEEFQKLVENRDKSYEIT